jgi:hypothetical protein
MQEAVYGSFFELTGINSDLKNQIIWSIIQFSKRRVAMSVNPVIGKASFLFCERGQGPLSP